MFPLTPALSLKGKGVVREGIILWDPFPLLARRYGGTIYKLFALHPIFPTHPFAIIMFNAL
ncbi:hypothetical protein AXY04_02120 [Enterobacter asburiae]|jgi:hypothetical protein|nr:hypothetical protein AXY04_02120 [Enterobacter asburiae]